MAHEAEIKLRTTMDGTQAEREVSKLRGHIKTIGEEIEHSWTKKFYHLFSAREAISVLKEIAHEFHQVVKEADELNKKLREGKATREDLEEAGISKGNLAYGSIAAERSHENKAERANFLLTIARIAGTYWNAGAGVFGMRGTMENISPITMSEQFKSQNADRERIEKAEQLERIKKAAEEEKYKASRTSDEAVAKAKEAALKMTQSVSGDANPLAREHLLKSSFSQLQRMGAYAYTGDQTITIQRNQLTVLRQIERSVSVLRFGPNGESLKTVFPD